MGVCAAVVTFNRKALLADCLTALRAQTRPVEKVVVVDNACTDGTREMLSADGTDPRVEVVALATNGGSAGGMAAAVKAGGRSGAGWIWLMDDDAAPEPDCLERLLAAAPAARPATAALCPAVVRPGGGVDLAHRGTFRRRQRPLPLRAYVPGTAPRLDFFSWPGTLLRTSAAQAAGSPKRELFIWGDDLEYALRVREHGEIRLVPEARIVHHEPGRVAPSPRSRFWNRVLRREFDPTPIEAFWRNLCGVRNYIWIKQRYEGQGALSAAGTTAQFMVKSLLYDHRPLGRLPLIARAARDGRRGDFSRAVAP